MSKKNTRRKISLITICSGIGVIAIVFGIFLFNSQHYLTNVSTHLIAFDFGNQKYILNDESLTFVNGSYTSNDVNGGNETATITNRTLSPSGNLAAAILVDNPGGSGTFYYLIGAMKNSHEIYSSPVFLGDRIKIVSITVEDPESHDYGEIIVRYLDRSQGEAMIAEPTNEVTKRFSFLESGDLVEVLH